MSANDSQISRRRKQPMRAVPRGTKPWPRGLDRRANSHAPDGECAPGDRYNSAFEFDDAAWTTLRSAPYAPTRGIAPRGCARVAARCQEMGGVVMVVCDAGAEAALASGLRPEPRLPPNHAGPVRGCADAWGAVLALISARRRSARSRYRSEALPLRAHNVQRVDA